jgi:hypothetical protein
MKPLTTDLAEGLLTWRNEGTKTAGEALLKRIAAGVALPCLAAAAIVESAARGAFYVLSKVFSFLSGREAGDWGSWELLKETVLAVPFFALAFVDNFYSKNLDKDNGMLMRSYARIVFTD